MKALQNILNAVEMGLCSSKMLWCTIRGVFKCMSTAVRFAGSHYNSQIEKAYVCLIQIWSTIRKTIVSLSKKMESNKLCIT